MAGIISAAAFALGFVVPSSVWTQKCLGYACRLVARRRSLLLRDQSTQTHQEQAAGNGHLGSNLHLTNDF